ncbi:MAG: hypothetical protein ACR2OU_21190 [Thermomicrobiales bacterium]
MLLLSPRPQPQPRPLPPPAPVADARSVPTFRRSEAFDWGEDSGQGFRDVLRRASLRLGDVVIGALLPQSC